MIRPDYKNKTVLDVYKDVVKYHLGQSAHDLDFLGHALHQQENQEVASPLFLKPILPSWVPNFAAAFEISPVPKTLCVPRPDLNQKKIAPYDKRGVPNGKDKQIPAFEPLGNVPSRSFIEGNLLYTSGVYIDVIQDIIKNTGPDIDAIRAAAAQKTRRWATELQNKYFNGESYSDAIKRNVVMDLVYDDLARPSERGGKYDSAFMKKPRGELTPVEYQHQNTMRIALNKASGQRDIGLSRLHYLLMIPNTAAVDDMIWALAGGQALYILRPVNQETHQYRYIGECYAHGLMDGEILRRLDVGEARMDDISLV